MEQCPFCQGSLDEATGICRQCGRATLATLAVSATPNQAMPESRCPGCGEEVIERQRFCRKCGLALTALAGQQKNERIEYPIEPDWSEAETPPDGARAFEPDSHYASPWSEAPTLPAFRTGAVSTRSAAVPRRRAWLPFFLLVVAGISIFSGYLLIHAQTSSPQRSISGVGASTPASGASATSGPMPSSTPNPAQPVGTGYWHTNGTQIVDANNRPVRIAGINWFGFESPSYVVHGLGQRDYHDLLNQVKSLGYNTIRLPFSDQLFFANSVPNGISFGNGMNQDLQGLNGLQILDKIVAAAGQLGLKIILDHHGVDAGSQVALWSAPDCSVSCFESDWQMLATHYNGNSTIIGADLDNEPHSPACWGCGDPALDWQMEAQKLGNEVLAINPHWLIFVEGVECYKGDCYWWGGNLEGVADTPVQLSVPNRVVYSPHDYPPDVYNLHYFNAPDYPNNLVGIWDAHWGFIVKKHIAPLWLGEFGTLLDDTKDQQWFTNIVAYLGTGVTGINWTYWALNPDSVDTGGILQNNWATVNQNKQDYLNPIEFPLSGSGSVRTPPPAATSTPLPAPSLHFQVTPTTFQQACSTALDQLSPLSVTLDNTGSTVAADWEVSISDSDPAGNVWATASNVSGSVLAGQSDTLLIIPFSNTTTTLCKDMQAAQSPMSYRVVLTAPNQSVTITDTITPPGK